MPRARICLACRTLLDEGEECSGKKHVTAALAGEERKLVDDEVWGPDSRARQMRQAARAGAGGFGAGSLLQGCDACGSSASGLDACGSAGGLGEALVAVVAFIVVAVVFAAVVAVLVFLVRALVNWLREVLHRPQPHGALREPPRPKKRAVAARGVVRGGRPIAVPWRAGSAFGYAMELYEKRVLGGGAMLRDAATEGFDVTLDDGRTLTVPAGRIRVLGGGASVESDKKRVEDFLEAVDVERGRERPLFPFDHVRGVTIDPGDRIELVGEVTTTFDEAAGYRGSAKVVPVGVPMLRVHKPAGGRVAAAPPRDDAPEGEDVEADEDAALPDSEAMDDEAGKRLG